MSYLFVFIILIFVVALNHLVCVIDFRSNKVRISHFTLQRRISLMSAQYQSSFFFTNVSLLRR